MRELGPNKAGLAALIRFGCDGMSKVMSQLNLTDFYTEKLFLENKKAISCRKDSNESPNGPFLLC